ncbi:hypothetical protein [Thermoflavifilum thermophilum]|uniref:Uncharacterized protein n=1 Tax=Thermoflavifilum thermophilum TaxID=1393122 RepID=A0A1I7N1A7_9BACT|nr:hypothetical protein [Thermoflavifilum thermophilum]SFV28415.1 hypothetical protein SAMN05660895_0326 [Thermoflavifilum thermophilum]
MNTLSPVAYDYQDILHRLIENEIEMQLWKRRMYLAYWLQRMELCMQDEIESLIDQTKRILLLAGEYPDDHIHAVFVDEQGRLMRSWMMSSEAFQLLIHHLPVKDTRTARFLLYWIRHHL